MLTITVGAADVFDDETQEFKSQGGFELQLEHSLVSLSKWESIYEKPFIDTQEKTPEELLSYIKTMTLTSNVPDEIYHTLLQEHIEKINTYIGARMTATWFSDAPGVPKSREIVTAEIIYYWMTIFNIPFECQYWHLNRLFTLIRICNTKQSKPQKMSRAEIAARNRELNAQRRAQLGTKG